MASPEFTLNRRELVAGLGALALSPALPTMATAQQRPGLTLSTAAGRLALRPVGQQTPIWEVKGADLRRKRGEKLDIALRNDLPIPTILNWRGLDGASVAEALTARAPLAAGGTDTIQVPLRHSGTFLCDAGLLGDGQTQPVRSLPLIVSENEPIPVERDELMLIEEWRLRPDGSAISPGTDPKGTVPLYTLNGQASFELSTFAPERLRLRFINGSQRTVLAVKFENHDVRVMAIDSEPAEPFSARNGALVLPPGGRVDAFVDTATAASILLHDGKESHPIGKLVISGVSRRRAPLQPALPLPSNGLPAQLDLKSAQRVELGLGGPPTDWTAPAKFAASAPPAFRAKAGRTVVLALTNRDPIANVFHLHGHHFRLLDRLDDGWKPFWLDTLAIEPGQTQRIAFLAEYPGRFLIESVATDWAAPRLVRWYSVA